ncbi:MAG: GNAT family N-acetyltransferase [Bacteroidota bacterium]
MENLTFILLSPQDEPFIKDMLYEAIYVAEGQPPFEKSLIEKPPLYKYFRHWGKVGDLGYALEVDKQWIGAAWSRLYTLADPGYGFINEATPELNIALKAAYRSKGWGSKLMHHLLAKLREKKFDQVSLSVDLQNPARPWYQRLGFEMIREDGNSWTMLLKLSNGSFAINLS